MGWWTQDENGSSFAGDGTLMWGDEPADAMSLALDDISAAFRAHLGRPPTIEEIRAGLRFATQKQETGEWLGHL